MKLQLGLLSVALLCVLVLGACDSGDPIDEPEPRDVAGRYSFTEFIFQPSSSLVQPINVLDTLVVGRTHLDLSSGGNFIFAYEFMNGDQFFLSGNFAVTANSVRIDGDREHRSSYNKLLLNEDFTLRRSSDTPGVLIAEVPQTIDPATFSDRYEGIGSLSGTLRLRLVKQ